ncbi:lactonase family protein [Bacillus sp. 1P06AnD]|uniref:lactonase family protein n=1 Tax=Bacillus sp. 1P06AnD TaxID=3132208 RepID=UPI0039A3BF17
MTKYTGYVGTYTKGNSKGVYAFTLDTDNKNISGVQLAAEIDNPTYINITKDQHTLYATAKKGDLGGVAAYAIQPGKVGLQLKNIQLSEGSSPCYVAVNEEQTHVSAAYYHRGTVELMPVIDGELQAASSTVQSAGSGPNPERQEKPHLHFFDFTPDGLYAVAIDLGTDQLKTYSIHNHQLKEVQSFSTKQGSGPRHIAFHPNGKYAYIMTELSNEVIVMDYNKEDGSFTSKQYIKAIPESFTENSQGSAIHVSSDGRFVYAGNRGHDSIAIFSIDPVTGELAIVDYVSTEGAWPRDFAFDPTEQFIIASNQESHNLVLFERNKETGLLTLISSDTEVPYPVCIKFLSENE